MATKPRTLAPLLLLSIFLLSATSALSQKEDPKLRECKERCQGPHFDEGMRRQCELRCELERQREREREGERGGDNDRHHWRDPERRLEQCRKDCQQSPQGGQEQLRCEQRCQREFEKERSEQGGRREDPERRLERCRKDCQQSPQGHQEQRRCEQRCQREFEKERREQGRDQSGRREDARERLRECRQECREEERQGRTEVRECLKKCDEEFERRRQEGGNPRWEEGEEEGERESPYFFGREGFRHWVRSEHGSVRVLPRFSDKSWLLKGIDNYRVAVLEAEPSTFIVPSHWDADALLYVVRGEGAITLLRKDNRESHSLRQGDVITVSAGTIVYLVNKSNNQKLYIAKLIQTVSTPGHFEGFFSVGGGEPESFYQAFSNDVLEAAFNAPREKLQRLFGQQRKGAIIKATEEQIRGIGRHSEGGPWPFGGESKRTSFNLLSKRPTHSSRRGQLFEADEDDYQQLRDLDVQISFANITRGSMAAPFYNSRATKVALVTQGRGYFEMVCPHLAGRQGWRRREGEEREGQGQGQRYQRVRSSLTSGSLYVVLPGHPVVTVASQEENLQVLCFEIHAENNRRTFLAGKNSVMKQMEREAEELSFSVPARLVEEVFNAQQEEVFVAGPEERRRRGEGRGEVIESVLNLAGF